MKKKFFARLSASVVTLAMLFPCLVAAPASATGTGEKVELWKWEATITTAGIEESMAMFPSNVVNEIGERQYTCFVSDSTMYDEEGPFGVKTFRFRNGTNTQDGKHYGTPYVIVNGHKKAAETLRFELAGVDYPLDTTGLAALNLCLTNIDTVPYEDPVMAYCRVLQVFVSLDGETWLEDSVGIRSTKLVGGGISSGSNAGLLYEIQTENLFDIDGLEPGDVIQNIMVRPEGSTLRPVNAVGFRDMALNGYTTKEAWEAAVPEEDREIVKMDPDILRQIVVEECFRTAKLPWTTDTTIDLTSPQGSSATATSFYTRQYVPGIQYYGPVYDRVTDATREQLAEAMAGGKYVGGYGTDTALGMDCQTFAFNATSRVSQNYGWASEFIHGAPGISLLGEEFLKTSMTESGVTARFTDAHVVDLNTPQDMYESYALADTGDIVNHYTSDASILVHIRIVQDVVTVRNADGTIDPDKSYMICAESSSNFFYEVRMPDGSIEWVQASDPKDLYAFLEQNSGSEVVCGHTTYCDRKYTFTDLINTKYVAYTLDVYSDGLVEMPDVEVLFCPMETNAPFWQSGLHLAVASNYRVIDYTVKLEDRATGKVLFEEFLRPQADPQNVGFNYENEQLNDLMRNLTNGSYRLSITVSSGPLTELGQSDVPKTTKYVDFSVTGVEPEVNVYLFTATGADKGESVEVLVRTSEGFDAADVEVKYDPEALTYVGGEYSPWNGQGWIHSSEGLVRVLCVDVDRSIPEQIAKLTFTARKDISSLSDAVQIKSALLSTAEAANDSNAIEATDKTQPCASIGMVDVSAGVWYHDAVDYVMDNGIMAGYNKTAFGPNDKMSRAMVVQILYNKEGQPAMETGQKFVDVKNEDWFGRAVAWGAQNGVVAGYGDGRFGPNDDVTIEQVAVALWNYAGSPEGNSASSKLSDHSDWATDALNWAEGKGLFEDVPVVTFTGTATRAQTAQMLMNFLAE